MNFLVADRLQKCKEGYTAYDFDDKKIKVYTTAGRIKQASNPSRKGFSDLSNTDASGNTITSFVPSPVGYQSPGVLGSNSDLDPRTKSEMASFSQSFQDILKEIGVDWVG